MYASFQNIGALAEIAGEPAAQALRDRGTSELGHVGPTFTTSGGDFVTIAGGDVGTASDRLRPLSWLVHAFLGVTEAWRLRAKGERLQGLVPRRLLELSCGLRFGVVALEAGDGLPACLERARAISEEQKLDKRGVTRFGFPPLWPERFRTLTQISDPICPACAARPFVLENLEDDRTLERCGSCDLEYERQLVWLLGGRQVGGEHTRS